MQDTQSQPITSNTQSTPRQSISKSPIEIDGVIKTLSKWCEIYNIPYTRAAMRYRRGVQGEALFKGGPESMRKDGKTVGYQYNREDSDKPHARSNLPISNAHAQRVRVLAEEQEMSPVEVLDTIMDNFFKKWDKGT